MGGLVIFCGYTTVMARPGSVSITFVAVGVLNYIFATQDLKNIFI